MKVSRIYAEYNPVYAYIKFNSGTQLKIWCMAKNNFGYSEKPYPRIMRSMKLGIVQLLNILKKYCDATELKSVTKLRKFLDRVHEEGIRTAGKVKNWRDYDLWKEIENSPFLKGGNPQAKALAWYRKDVMNNEVYFSKANLLQQGFLYTFNYDTPKYESVLDYFDTQPLVISFGPIDTSLGKRDIGINLHLLPPRIRRIVMYKIFEMYRNMYKEQLFSKDPKTVMVTWKAIATPLLKYGIAFAIRMYIPELRKNAIRFRYEDWAKAIYLPSKRLAKTTQEELERLWAKFVKEQQTKKTSAKNLNENWKNS